MDNKQDYRGKKRVVQYKLDHNKKQLEIAIKEGNKERILKIERNIEQYEKELKKIEKGV